MHREKIACKIVKRVRVVSSKAVEINPDKNWWMQWWMHKNWCSEDSKKWSDLGCISNFKPVETGDGLGTEYESGTSLGFGA